MPEQDRPPILSALKAAVRQELDREELLTLRVALLQSQERTKQEIMAFLGCDDHEYKTCQVRLRRAKQHMSLPGELMAMLPGEG